MLKRMDQIVRRFENILAILLIIGVVGIVTAQIVFRFFLSKPLSWSQEIATFMLIWAVLMGMAIAQRDRVHIAVNVFLNQSLRFAPFLRFLPWLTMFGLFIIFGFGGVDIAVAHSAEKSPSIGMPMWIVYCGFPFAAILGVWHLVTELPALLHRRAGDVK